MLRHMICSRRDKAYVWESGLYPCISSVRARLFAKDVLARHDGLQQPGIPTEDRCFGNETLQILVSCLQLHLEQASLTYKTPEATEFLQGLSRHAQLR